METETSGPLFSWLLTLLVGAAISIAILGFCHRREWKWRLLLLQSVNVMRRIIWLPWSFFRQKPWEDPNVFAQGKLPSHAPLRYAPSAKVAREGGASPNVVDLSKTASWRLQIFPNPKVAEAFTHARDSSFDDHHWDEVPAPSNWQMLGISVPIYTNITFPFTGVPLLLAPYVSRQNPTGLYRTVFNVSPEKVEGQRIHLVFHAVGSAVMVWVDGQYVGYSQDSMTAAEFDITNVLKQSKKPADGGDSPSEALLSGQHRSDHVLVAMVPMFCDGSYLEDQDQWWLSGIHRPVELHFVPESCFISDYTTETLLQDAEGLLKISCQLSGPSAEAAYIRFSLGDLEGSTVLASCTAVAKSTGDGWCITAELKVPNVQPWSAEDPYLYGLLLELLNSSQTVLQAEHVKIGFRCVDIWDGQLRVNGQPITVAGANVHEMHPLRGKAITEEDMLLDIKKLKEGNFNAVRNSHYPHHPRWYELCDEYGFYVVDEANIETHGFVENLAISLLACDWAWRDQFLHRARNLFQRAKNHPCVIVWSLGNESGWGPNFAACADALRRWDPQRRPVQYEGAEHHGDAVFFCGDGQGPSSDIICPMYWSPPMILPLAAPDASRRPVILCEYSHALGNSNGSLHSYWQLFWSSTPEHRQIQGGFVWEWADAAIKVHRRRSVVDLETAKGKIQTWLEGEYGFGGDFGPSSGKQDSHFVLDGILFPDRSPHPAYYEFKRLQQPVAFEMVRSSEMEGSKMVLVKVTNRYSFKDLGHLSLAAFARDGSGASHSCAFVGPATLNGILPGESKELSVQLPRTPADHPPLRDFGLWLFIEARQSESSKALPAGYVIADCCITIEKPEPFAALPGSVCAGSMAPRRSLHCGDAAVLERGNVTVVKAAGYVAKLGASHRITLTNPKGVELLADASIRPCFSRATLDNDRCGVDFFVPWLAKVPVVSHVLDMLGFLSMNASWTLVGLQNLLHSKERSEWTNSAEGPKLSIMEILISEDGQDCLRVTLEYIFGAESIFLTASVALASESCPVAHLPSLPRVGLRMVLPSSFSKMTWLGCGPGETYPDRKAAGDWSIHCKDVDDLGVDYIVPSENGGRADVHWAAFTARTGDGLLFQYLCPDAAASLDDPKDGAAEQRPRNMQGAQVSASRLSLEELENTSHRHLLPKVNESRPVHVHLDTAHAGVGGVGEGGSKLWATATQFLINPKCGPWNFSVILTPIDSETWLHHATPAGA